MSIGVQCFDQRYGTDAPSRFELVEADLHELISSGRCPGKQGVKDPRYVETLTALKSDTLAILQGAQAATDGTPDVGLETWVGPLGFQSESPVSTVIDECASHYRTWLCLEAEQDLLLRALEGLDSTKYLSTLDGPTPFVRLVSKGRAKLHGYHIPVEHGTAPLWLSAAFVGARGKDVLPLLDQVVAGSLLQLATLVSSQLLLDLQTRLPVLASSKAFKDNFKHLAACILVDLGRQPGYVRPAHMLAAMTGLPPDVVKSLWSAMTAVLGLFGRSCAKLKRCVEVWRSAVDAGPAPSALPVAPPPVALALSAPARPAPVIPAAAAAAGAAAAFGLAPGPSIQGGYSILPGAFSPPFMPTPPGPMAPAPSDVPSGSADHGLSTAPPCGPFGPFASVTGEQALDRNRCDVLAPRQYLSSRLNGRIRSQNGRYSLVQQSDSHLVLYKDGREAIWANQQRNKGVVKTIMQARADDGNLVSYNAAGKPLWSSNTWGRPGAYLVVHNDGSLVIYHGKRPVWAVNTGGRH
ncbi:hypothetical protein HYH03_019004 [Edaphochlamys debaryana]|uniref:Bulb-type lectin domain-containing protein n=1 Tax=Edaphochlamys debaryana TaxID=47281 RepID=A0A835XDL2_9CHLO|nr:hypothetical protein HYH03_019003 [Edaphochlamys debaryana]KAG2482044.1 hypothetical protein HYH03_019004 [Edaphochlamys debaryana]|eukprot:KAG2482043.1 hypothetical protein HYH03_019003 [Edaphochlamys debaryana]